MKIVTFRMLCSSTLWLAVSVALLSICCFAAERSGADLSKIQHSVETERFSMVEDIVGIKFDRGRPVAFVFEKLNSSRLFVATQYGEVFVGLRGNGVPTQISLNLSGQIRPGGEAGLLGLALHPDFENNGFLYVFYTADVPQEDGVIMDNRLSRFQISPENPEVVALDSEVILFSQPDRDGNHNAGDLHFGPDGYLYVSLGDGGGNGNVVNAQRIDQDFFSGILRIDVDKRPGNLEPNPHPAIRTNDQGQAHYSIPVDNPFIGVTNFNSAPVDPSKVRTEFWAVGFRNPWRMSFDSLTGDLYVGDVGAGKAEEINWVVRGGNYGWPYFEGTNANNPPDGFESIPPICNIPWGNGDLQGRSVIGGVVYRGAQIPELYGAYLFADFTGGKLWKLVPDGTNLVPFELLLAGTQISAFGIDPENGDVLVAAHQEGKIKRLIYGTVTNGFELPPRLSETGAFRDLATLESESGILPYDLNVPFWSDYAVKTRWFSIPDTNQTMTFSADGNWQFPTGTVWIKHFELELTNGVPESRRRLETRFLVKKAEGVLGFTYRWNESQTDAELVESGGLEESIAIRRDDGSVLRNQTWRYPSHSECLQCHTAQGGHALGFNAAQLNRERDFGEGLTNQISHLEHLGYFDGPVPGPETLPRLAGATDTDAPLEHRVRSYLQANCVQCHQPGGTALGFWDARIASPLSAVGILEGALSNTLGNETNRVVRPGSLEHSVLYRRIAEMGAGHMPPLGTFERNEEAVALVREWVTSMIGSLVFTVDQDGYAYITYPGVPGRTYRVEASEDLVAWLTIGTVRAPASGMVKFLEPASERSTARFYRLVRP